MKYISKNIFTLIFFIIIISWQLTIASSKAEALTLCPLDQDYSAYSNNGGSTYSSGTGEVGLNVAGFIPTCGNISYSSTHTCLVTGNNNHCYPGYGTSGYHPGTNIPYCTQASNNNVNCPSPIPLHLRVEDRQGRGVKGIQLHIHYGDNPAISTQGFDAIVTTDNNGDAVDSNDLYSGDHFVVTIASGNTYPGTFSPTIIGDETATNYSYANQEMNTYWSCGTEVRDIATSSLNPPCTFIATAYVSPTPTPTLTPPPTSTISATPTAIVTSSITPTPVCSVSQRDFMLIIDHSGSMQEIDSATGKTKLTDAKNAVNNFIDLVSQGNQQYNIQSRVGLSIFGSADFYDSYLLSGLTNNFTVAKNLVNNIQLDSGTCAQCGIYYGNESMDAQGASQSGKVGIILTDGISNELDTSIQRSSISNDPVQAAIDEANFGHQRDGTIFYTIGLGRDANLNFLYTLANNTRGSFYYSSDGSTLKSIYNDIYSCKAGGVTPNNTISGTIYDDTNTDGYFNNPPEQAHNGSVAVEIWQAGSKVTTITTTTGVYTSPKLTEGTYDIKISSLPFGYYITYPLNGPPPTYTVTIGKNCNTNNNYHDMSCNSGNVVNLNFGLSPPKPWLQSYCADIRMDSGFVNPISAYASCTINGQPPAGPYAVIDNNCANPGMIFTGNQPYDLNGQKANTNNNVIGGFQYPEAYSPSVAGVIRTSFDYMLSTARQSGLTPTDMKTICQNGNLNKKNGSSGCILSNPPHGLYMANDDVDLNDTTLPSGQNYVFLINGKLTLYGKVLVPNTSTLVVSARKDIVVDSSVGGSSGSTQGDIEGLYSSDQSFRINSTGTCPDKHLTIAGSVVVNAGHTGGTFANTRTLCDQNLTCAVVSVIHRPDMLLNAPSFIKHTNFTWREMNP